jgi:hypothetical protein
MQSLTHALNGAVPRLQKFRMRQSEIAPPNDFGFLLYGQFVGISAEQFSPVLFKPHSQTLPLLRSQSENCLFQLLQAHVMQFIKLQPPRESEIC